MKLFSIRSLTLRWEDLSDHVRLQSITMSSQSQSPKLHAIDRRNLYFPPFYGCGCVYGRVTHTVKEKYRVFANGKRTSL